jgi:thioredoxin reductase
MSTPAIEPYDVAVVGGGAAGLSAALVLGRAQRRVVVNDRGHPRNAPAEHMQGYLSRDGMRPSDLLAIGRSEVASYGVELIDDTVSEIVRTSTGAFGLQLDNGQSITARRLLITTGLRDQVPDLPGVTERWGRDLLHCPYCHGHEVRDLPIGVLGGSPGAVQHALLLRQWSPDVVFFSHTTELDEVSRELLAARAIDVVEGTVERLVIENDALSGVALTDGRIVRRSVVFVRPEFVPSSGFITGLGGQVDDAGWPRVDASGQSTAPGVWAAGNAANPRAQVITAAGEGSAVAIAINHDLTEEDVRNDVDAFRAGHLAPQPTPEGTTHA